MNRLFDGLVEASFATMVGLAGFMALAFGLVYVLGEIDGRRTGGRDPALGVKVATAMLATVSFQIALVGLTALLTGFATDMGRFTTKPAAGMLIGALVAGTVPLLMYVQKLRTGAGYAVGRKAIGLNTLVCGLAFTILTVTQVTLAMSGAEIEGIISGWLVYGTATFTGLGHLLSARHVSPEQARS